eukprot:6183476-Pleurochrysis_carterae.AAC.6
MSGKIAYQIGGKNKKAEPLAYTRQARNKRPTFPSILAGLQQRKQKKFPLVTYQQRGEVAMHFCKNQGYDFVR